MKRSVQEVIPETHQEQEQVQEQPEVEVQEVQDVTLDQRFEELAQQISSMKLLLSTVQSSLRTLKSSYKTELKTYKKKRSKKENGKKRGEFKPVCLSKELATFFNVKQDTVMERRDVTKKIYNYIQSHNLYLKDSPKTTMKPDAKLAKLFGPMTEYIKAKNPELGQGLSIYNIQKYLQKHLTTATPEQLGQATA